MDFDLPDPRGPSVTPDGPDGPDDDLELAADLNDTAQVSCPYCGEESELMVDVAGGTAQEYVEDCQVCCRPWLVRVQLDAEGYASVTATTLDDE